MTQLEAVASEERPAAVYRLWAADEVLLYIGSSYDPDRRCVRHQSTPWWSRVVRRTDEWHSTRSDAFAAEYLAIWREDPACNVWGTRAYAGQAPRKGRRSYLMWTGKRDVWPTDLDQLKAAMQAYDEAAASPDDVMPELREQGEAIAAHLGAAARGLAWEGRRRLITKRRRRIARDLRATGITNDDLARVMAVANARILSLPHLFDDEVLT
ncbi:hypothetical protein DI272_19045 [Streptomyces sp. Act143]|uniref:hypothetical protein n=1 Tax=Streptomyces sp. Act143 TaxID=2200760 RepID=UPI000D684A7A|nr:hypothetical protein [Streptomyces sp. Act143]PWI16031.1 hypothetical protein DI272_19045 [Streptomyces sp. Act143]